VPVPVPVPGKQEIAFHWMARVLHWGAMVRLQLDDPFCPIGHWALPLLLSGTGTGTGTFTGA